MRLDGSLAFIDTHCHFDFPPFIEEIMPSVQRAEQAGITQLIIPAVTADRFSTVIELSERYLAIYAALGLHPIYIDQHTEGDQQLLQQHLQKKHAKVVAVGEIGLDRYIEDPQFARQLHCLQQQLILAKQYDLPVILHSRKTHDQLAQILKQNNLPCTGVIHGFSGSTSQAHAFIKLGYAIGVGGVITYPRAQKTRTTIAQLPLSSLLLETDAPDMPLYGRQGQANRPEYIREVFQALCVLRPQESPDLIARTLIDNSHRIFSKL